MVFSSDGEASKGLTRNDVRFATEDTSNRKLVVRSKDYQLLSLDSGS